MTNPMRVLIIDDDAVDRQATRRVLQATGLTDEIAEAQRGEEALERLAAEDFDAVLLDFQLTDTDGLWVLREARSRRISVPIIVLTDYGDEHVAVDLIKAGAADCLPKDRLSADLLGQSLRHIARMREVRAEAERADKEREQLLSSLAAAQGQTEAVLSSMTEGLIVSNLTGSILTMNPAALAMLGFDMVEVARLPLSAFPELLEVLSLEGDPLPLSEWPLSRALNGESFSLMEVVIRPRGTGRTWIGSFGGTPVRNQAGEMILAIVTVRDITEAKQAEARAALLAEAGTRLSASLNAQTTLETVARVVVPDHADWCAIHALDADGLVRPLMIAQDLGTGPEMLPLPPPFQLALDAVYGIAFVLRTGTAQIIPEVTEEVQGSRVQQGAIRTHLLEIGVNSYLCVPLIVRGRVLGSLSLAFAGGRRVYDEQYLALAVELGYRVAAGLENARLFEDLRERAEREAMLNQIGSALRVSLDADEILRSVTEQIGQALGVSRCCFLRFDPAASTLEAAPQQYLAPGIGQAVSKSALAEWPPEVVEGWNAGRSAVVSGDASAWISCPVFSRGQLSGVLVADQIGESAWVWSRDEAAFVSAVADILALALENARLYAREHRVADMLSSAFLTDIPYELPGLTLAANYRAGLEEAQVGGDYYDAFTLPDGRVALVIADVSGKGLSAAVQTATVKYSLRAFATEAAAPGLVVTRLNRMLCSELAGLGDHFVTLFYAVFEPATGRLSWTSAGHESMLIKRSAGGSDFLNANGPILGLAEHAYTQDSAFLAPGDSLVLYTDGLTEVRDLETRALLNIEGVQKLVESVPVEAGPGAIASYLQQSALRWAAGRPQDDMALMVVQRRSEVSPETPPVLPEGLTWERGTEDLFQFQFPSRADYVGEVRQVLGHWMAVLGFTRADTEDFQTAVTEAVTNAVRHGSPDSSEGQFYVLGRRTISGALHVEVTDSGGGLTLTQPLPAMPEPDAPGGRGLPLMQELADTVEFRPAPRGLCVVLVKHLPS